MRCVITNVACFACFRFRRLIWSGSALRRHYQGEQRNTRDMGNDRDKKQSSAYTKVVGVTESNSTKAIDFCFWCCVILTITQGAQSLKCNVGEYPIYFPEGSFVLDLSQTSGLPNPLTVDNSANEDECSERCRVFSQFDCKSFSYGILTKECTLYSVSGEEADVRKRVISDVKFYRGICSLTPDLQNCDQTIDKIDLAFVVDGSGSICDGDPTKNKSNRIDTCNNWIKLKQFIKQIVFLLPIGPDKTRVALVVFANKGEVKFNFSSHLTGSDVLRAIDNLEYPGGNTNTYEGLHLMRRDLYKIAGRTESEAKKLAFIITDGKATKDTNLTEPEAKLAQSEGILMYAVGITDKVDTATLRILSSPPHELKRNYFQSPNFDELQPVINDLLSASCIRLNPRFLATVNITSTGTFLSELEQHPGYLVLMFMAAVILFLFITAVVILCHYKSPY